MPTHVLANASSRYIPEPYTTIIAGACEQPTIWTERNGGDSIIVRWPGSERVIGVYTPDSYRMIGARAGECAVSRAACKRCNAALMSIEHLVQLPGARIPHMHAAV